MGETSENVAQKYNVTRQQQDQIAFLVIYFCDFLLLKLYNYRLLLNKVVWIIYQQSQERAAQAASTGKFAEEIVPVYVEDKNEKASKQVVLDQDEGIRPTTLQALSKLKPAFKQWLSPPFH